MSFRVSLQEQHGVALPHLLSARWTHWNGCCLAVSDNTSTASKQHLTYNELQCVHIQLNLTQAEINYPTIFEAHANYS